MNSVQTHEHPAADTDNIDIPDFLLMPIVEAAYQVIMRSEGDDVPSNLRRISHFDSKSLNDPTSRAQILQSMRTNREFRARVEDEFFGRVEATVALQQWRPALARDIVADAASRNDLALLASVLWLKRPEQYAYGLGLIAGSASMAIVENEQRDSLRADETRFAHLSQKVEKEKSRADLLKADVDRLETELRQERTAKRISEQRSDAQVKSLQKTIDDHDEVVSRQKEAKTRVQQRFEREASRAQELEARLKIMHDENKSKSDKISQLQEQLASALSSDMELDYEDLQKLLGAQKDAQEIADTIMAIMSKTRTIVSQQSPPISSGTISPTEGEALSSSTEAFPSLTASRPSGRSEPKVSSLAADVRFENASAEETAATPVVEVPRGNSFAIDAETVLLVDGYSVGHNMYRDLPRELQRERTIENISKIEAAFHCSCVVVFDGESSTTRGRVQSKVHIVYSPSASPASDVIVERIKVTPPDKNIVLVTGDTQLAQRIDKARCRIVSPEKFTEDAASL